MTAKQKLKRWGVDLAVFGANVGVYIAIFETAQYFGAPALDAMMSILLFVAASANPLIELEKKDDPVQ